MQEQGFPGNRGEFDRYREGLIRKATPITVSELLGRAIEDSEGLTIDTDPTHIFRVSQIEFLAVIETPLESRSFNQLLSSVSPDDTFALGKKGILDDWVMPKSEVLMDQKLKEFHEQALGKHWRDFMPHLSVFFNTLLGYEGRLREALNRFSGKLSQIEEPGIINTGTEGIKIQSKGSGRIQVNLDKLFKAEMDLEEDERGRLKFRIFPETVGSTNFLIPVVRWRRSGIGKRSLVLDFLDESVSPLVKETLGLDKIPEELDFDNRRLNPLLGVLSIAYFSPEVRKNWPKTQRLNKGGYQQFMGPAQVPVLALQRRNQILQSGFFSAAEEHVEKTGQLVNR